MKLLIHISDPHFGTEQPPVVEALVRLVHDEAPELVVLSGDITQRARRSQFRSAKTFTDRLGVPAILVIPGNHDIPLFNFVARLFNPYGNYRREFGVDLEPMFESDGLLAIALNTTRRYRHTDGEVSKAQIDRVASRLEMATATQLRVVVTHQPVCVTQAEDEINLLHGYANAIRRWAAAGADLILGGHIHLPYVCALHATHAGLARPVWAVQAGTAVSQRVRYGGSNSINLIRYGALQRQRHCSVERWDYLASTQSFVKVAIDALHFDAPGDTG
ncbi:MAG: metallophosphoesterase [Pseudomonadota bacterium]|nr:metallophosphoesterase [Pseudomonadota bacterium]